MDSYYLIKVSNSEICLNVFDLLRKNGIDSKIVASPSFLERGCGLSIKIKNEDYDKIVLIIRENMIKDDLILYRISINDEKEYNYKKINSI